MTYQAILFDLDGTLLPMDLDQFTEGYFHLLAQTAAPYGYREETLVPALWKGVGAMVKNQGNRSNCEAFWETFAQVLGPQVYDHIPIFDAFYATEFQKARSFTGPNPRASRQWHWPEEGRAGDSGHESSVPTGRRPDPAELGEAPAGGLRLGHRL